MPLLLLSGPTPVAAAPGTPTAVLTGARSSAIGLADLALVWSTSAGFADLAMLDSDLASDAGMTTAVLLSLMLDRRAEDDDEPPSGDPTDRRGWWADEFSTVEGDRIGSRLWLLDRSTITGETARLADEYVREALQWMIDDKVIASVDVTVDTTTRRDAAFISVALQRPGREAIALRFAHVWDAIT